MDQVPGDHERQRSFTSEKLNWMAGLAADPRIDSRAFEVGFCIAQHVNKERRTAILSDETIRDATNIPTRWVRRARRLLRDAGWIDWKRTRTANVYWTIGDNLSRTDDLLTVRREARAETRKRVKSGRQERPQVAYLKTPERPQVATLDRPQVADQERPQVADKHLRVNTLEGTPSKERGQPKDGVIGERGPEPLERAAS